MTDTRERARAFAAQWRKSNPNLPEQTFADRMELMAAAFASSEAALARKQERLECAKAVCKSCADNVPLRHMSWHWTHEIPGIGIGPCHAAAIHERNLADK